MRLDNAGLPLSGLALLPSVSAVFCQGLTTKNPWQKRLVFENRPAYI